MINKKIKISSKLIVSYFIILLITSLFVMLIFSISTRSYMENRVRKNLEGDLVKITQVVENNFNANRENEQGRIRGMPRFRVDLGSVEDWALVDKNFRVFYPRMGEEAVKFNEKILPAIKDKMINITNKPVKFQLDGIDYMALSSPVELKVPNRFNGWIIAYTYVGTVNVLRRGIVIVLLITLVFTGIIAIIVGIFSARLIAKPIIVLRNRAEMLSEWDFDTKVDIRTGDELEELANSINKVAAKLKEYDIAQKKFIQNASHELKTPLMSIQGYAEGIKDRVFENNEKALNVIIEESSRLKGLVEEIIYLSKLETLEGYYCFSEKSMNETIKDSVEKVNSLALKYGIKIDLMLSSDAKISIDRDKFVQAMINILGNCLRYARNEIRIKTANTRKWFEINISDDGDGFDGKEINNLFERFYKGKKGSTGLGLAITKVIIEKHGGTIKAGNSIDGGAEFLIRIPLK